MEKNFNRDLSSLDEIFQFIDSAAKIYHLNSSVSFNIRIIVEELFTNQLKYSDGGGDEVELRLEREGRKLRILVRDFNIQNFDISRIKPLDIDKPLEKRASGGLGLQIVTNLTDDLIFDYNNNTMEITAIYGLEEKNV